MPSLQFKYTIPPISEATAIGLADLQEFHNLDMKKLVRGEIRGK